jgi:TolB protein
MSFCDVASLWRRSPWTNTLFAIAIVVLLDWASLQGAEPIRLTNDGRQKTDLVFLRGGDELAFTCQESPTLLALMRLRMSDRSVERLHPDATTNEFELTLSADNRYHAFVQNRGNLNLKLVIRDTQENRDAVFDPGGGFSGMRRPTATPDAGRIAFSIPGTGGQVIASVNRQGQDKQVLTKGAINNWPAYSPDGRHLAFSSSRDGDFELYIMKADGSDVRRLTTSPGLDMRPAWSPDGKRLAFTSNRDGNYEIYVIHIDGSGLKRLTHHPERDDFPTWHPDGHRLAFVSERDGQCDIYMIPVAE